MISSFTVQLTGLKAHSITLLLLLTLASCATYTVNQPLDRVDSDTAYTFENIRDHEGGIKKDFIVISLSGGGTRAAALAYGVFKRLDDFRIGEDERTLLDKVSVISSVSGGSFVAAYYGLFGKDRFLREFPEKMLYHPIQRELIVKFLSPWNWPRLWSPEYGRSEMAEEYYARHLFGDHTFADLPLRWPLIVINATDMGRGARFSFVQAYFDRLCADLLSFPIARAVVASSAFPGGFSPVTLNNYPKECGVTEPPWVTTALAGDASENPAHYARARDWKSYQNTDARPYIHLIDGGVADNLGARQPVFAIANEIWRPKKGHFSEQVRRLILIIVDAKTNQPPQYGLTPSPPGLIKTLVEAGSQPLENYSSDTVEFIRQLFDELERQENNFTVLSEVCAELAAERCGSKRPCRTEQMQRCTSRFHTRTKAKPPYSKLYLIHLRFDLAKDPALQSRLDAVPTSLQLPAEEVDLVVDSAAILLQESSEFRRLLGDLGHTKR